jgi:hypothetical protein
LKKLSHASKKPKQKKAAQPHPKKDAIERLTINPSSIKMKY